MRTLHMLDEILTTIRSELSDLPDTAACTRVLMRLLMAAILGGIIGFEREHRGKAAGLRTHMLVALGSALFVLVPEQAGATNADLSRVVQGLVAGIGFLCAGSIVKGVDERGVHGLTTAAGLWLTAALGMTAGMGRELTAIAGTVLAWVVLSLLPAPIHPPESKPRDAK